MKAQTVLPLLLLGCAACSTPASIAKKPDSARAALVVPVDAAAPIPAVVFGEAEVESGELTAMGGASVQPGPMLFQIDVGAVGAFTCGDYCVPVRGHLFVRTGDGPFAEIPGLGGFTPTSGQVFDSSAASSVAGGLTTVGFTVPDGATRLELYMTFDRWSFRPGPCCDSESNEGIWDAPITDNPAGSYVSNYGKNFTLPVDAPPGTFDSSTWDVLFDDQAAPTLARFFSVAPPTPSPPLCFVDGSELMTYSGQGNYGLAVFEESVQDFEVWVDVEVPQGADPFLSNSGIFVRIEDPRLPVAQLPATAQQGVQDLISLYGPGVWSPNVTGYEVQLEHGYTFYPPSRQNGAMYDVPDDGGAGAQDETSYLLYPGQRYVAVVRVVGCQFDVYFRWTGSAAFQHVTSFTNVDPYRGAPLGERYFGIQAYYTDGVGQKALLFHSIRLNRL